MSIRETVITKKTSPKSLSLDIGEIVKSNYLPNVDINRRTLIKINGNFDKIYPGSNTSPWFLDALLAVLRDFGFNDLAVIEGDLMTFCASKMIQSTGLIKILDRYGVEFINYEKLPRDVSELPLLLDDAQMINTPVPHGHGLAKISCATKNLFGPASGLPKKISQNSF